LIVKNKSSVKYQEYIKNIDFKKYLQSPFIFTKFMQITLKIDKKDFRIPKLIDFPF